MEFASLEDAYGEVPIKKKKSKSKPDPDRPAVQRMEQVSALVRPHGEIEDEYLDESTKFQNRSTVNNSLPAPRTLSGNSTPAPSFFGAEPFTNPAEDTKAPFNSHDSPNAYMLESDFTKSFDQTGFGKSSGTSLPVPELRHRWKPLSADRVESAFYTASTESERRQSGQFSGMETGDIAAMRSKLDTLMARLDDLEYRAAGANPQMEMLSFIMTGLFLMFVLDLTVRKSGR
jgi:hypothetical protein